MDQTGGPAFPGQQEHCPDGTWNQTFDSGMTLLAWYAAKALPLARADYREGQIAEWQLKAWFGNRGGLKREEIISRAAFEYAAAMVAENETALKLREVA